MLDIKWFEGLDGLSAATGLDSTGLEAMGFDLDDFDFGFRADRRIHSDPVTSDPDDDGFDAWGMPVDPDREGRRLLEYMKTCGCGPVYVQYGSGHYYLVHHA